MRIYTFLIIVVGLMMLFNLAGINTATGYVLNKLNAMNPDGLGLTNFSLIIAAIFAVAVGGGVVIGFFTKSPVESIILVSYAEVLLLFLADWIFIMQYMNTNYYGWMSWIVSLIMFPLAVGYLHSVVSWWGARS